MYNVLKNMKKHNHSPGINNKENMKTPTDR